MKTVKVGDRGSHRMVLVAVRVDALTGDEWDILECHTCGLLQRVQWEPWKKETLRLGRGMLTPEDAIELGELCASGPTGRMKASQILARVPCHNHVRVPTEDELRAMAREQGRGDEFEQVVNEAIIEGEPLLTFGIGGAKASTWPKGFDSVIAHNNTD